MRITAKAADAAAATEIVDEEADHLRALLGPLVFGRDGDNMESAVLAALEARGHTLAVAESLTGGLLGSRLASVPGASAVFRGGVIAYHPEVKQQLLGVPDGPVVTEEAALAMARGARSSLGADVGLATTGVAGPEELEGQRVGTVCLAAVWPGGEASTTLGLPGGRQQIREFSCISVLDLLRRRMLVDDDAEA